METKKNHTICRRIAALALAGVAAFSLAACGKSSGGDPAAKPYVWVPEYVTIDDENVSYYDMQMVGDALFYLSHNWDDETETSSESICRYSVADGSLTSTPITWTEETGYYGINRSAFAEDGSMYGLTNQYSEDGSRSNTFLCKFGTDGKQVFEQEITDLVGDSYVDRLALDDQGRLYACGESNIWLFDSDGNRQGTVSLDVAGNGWIRGMGVGKDGMMYVSYYNNDGGYSLAQIDFEGKKVGATYDNFPNGNGDKLVPGVEKDFLVYDGSRVYEYDMKSQSQEELFSWLDSDINGSYVQNCGVLEDGRILAVTMDWDTNDNGIALLTKKKASEVPQKETIMVASLYGGSEIQSAAVKFNKENDRYHISIKEYVNFNTWDGDDYKAMWTDAINRLNNDITSSNCPDILDLSGLNIKQMAAKGVFEDLNGYLEKSDKVKREDFLENILSAYTVDGKLISIPYSFQMQTVAGKASDLGKEMGWTIDELIAYADAHPDAQIFDGASKSSIMMYLMMCNEDAFVDWIAGECHFDTDEFKGLLQFVNRFPEEVDYNGDSVSTPNKIQRGEVLLYEASIYNFEEIQVCEEIFQGDASYIGFPTMDGSAGCMFSATQTYAITSKSKQKEGAWEFIEGFLTQEETESRRVWGFSTLKSKLEAQAADAVKVEYLTDEDGNQIMDENGEPIVMGGGGGFSYGDGWSYDYRIPTQEEVDMVMSLIEIAKPMSYSQGDEVMNIINEETAAFYKGQKSVDEVASIIQSRVKIYIGENR